MLYDKRWDQAETPVEIRPDDWRDILNKAADILENVGWTRGSYETAGGHYCAIGAISIANTQGKSAYKFSGVSANLHFYNEAAETAHQKLLAAINTQPWYKFGLGREYVNIPQWNDESGRTKEQVVEMMRKAASE